MKECSKSSKIAKYNRLRDRRDRWYRCGFRIFLPELVPVVVIAAEFIIFYILKEKITRSSIVLSKFSLTSLIVLCSAEYCTCCCFFHSDAVMYELL